MTSRWTIAVTWARAHHVGLPQVAIVLLAWVAAAALTHVGLPPLSPGPAVPEIDLQLMGVAAVAVVAGLASLAMQDDLDWLSQTAARPVRRTRLAWVVTVWGMYLGGALAMAPLLPRGLPVLTGFVAAAAICFAVALIGSMTIGALGGLVAPLILMVALTGRMVPWEYNIVFNADLLNHRLVTACLGILLTCITYSLGAGTARRHD